jgi:hypothetical protein
MFRIRFGRQVNTQLLTCFPSLIMVAFEPLGLFKCNTRTPWSLGWFSKYDGNISGGFLIDTGMTLTGACPGTSLVQVMSGIRSGLFVVIGGILWGIFYAKFARYLRRTPANTAATKDGHTMYEKLDITQGSAVLFYEAACLVGVVIAIFLGPPRPDLLHSALGGLLICGAQAASLLLTSNAVGVSAV